MDEEKSSRQLQSQKEELKIALKGLINELNKLIVSNEYAGENKKLLEEIETELSSKNIKIKEINGAVRVLRHVVRHEKHGVFFDAVRGFEGSIVNRLSGLRKEYLEKKRKIQLKPISEESKRSFAHASATDIIETQKEEEIKPVNELELHIRDAMDADYTGDIAKEGGIDWSPKHLFTDLLNNFRSTKNKLELDEGKVNELKQNVEGVETINKTLGDVVPLFRELKTKRDDFLGEENLKRLKQLKQKRTNGISEEDWSEYNSILYKMDNALTSEEMSEYQKLFSKRKYHKLDKKENNRLSQLENKRQKALTSQDKRKIKEFQDRLNNNLGEDREEYHALMKNTDKALSSKDNIKFHEVRNTRKQLLNKREKIIYNQKNIATDLLKSTPLLEKYREQYKQGFLDIEYQFLKHPTGLKTAFAMSKLRDVLISELYQLAIVNIKKTNHSFTDNPPMAILTFGGYGREEVSPFSDVDLFFMFFKDGAYYEECNILRESVCNYLRIIGCGMESVDESAFRELQSIGNPSDLIKKLGLLSNDVSQKNKYNECRFLCGDVTIWNEYNKLQNKLLYLNFEDGIIRLKEISFYLNQTSFEHIKNEEDWKYEIKRSSEGLRVIHSLCWTLRGLYDIRKIPIINILEEAKNKKAISSNEEKNLAECYDYNVKLRNEIHYLHMREYDMLAVNDIKERISRHGKEYNKLIDELSSHFEKQKTTLIPILERLEKYIEIEKGKLISLEKEELEQRILERERGMMPSTGKKEYRPPSGDYGSSGGIAYPLEKPEPSTPIGSSGGIAYPPEKPKPSTPIGSSGGITYPPDEPEPPEPTTQPCLFLAEPYTLTIPPSTSKKEKKYHIHIDLYKRLGDIHDTVRHIHLIKEKGKKIYLTESHEYYAQLYKGKGSELRLCDYQTHKEYEVCRCEFVNGAVSFLISVDPECAGGEAKIDIFEMKKGIMKDNKKYIKENEYITKYTPLNPVFNLKYHFAQTIVNQVQNATRGGSGQQKTIKVKVLQDKIYKNPIADVDRTIDIEFLNLTGEQEKIISKMDINEFMMWGLEFYDKKSNPITFTNVKFKSRGQAWFQATLQLKPDTELGDLRVIARMYFGQDKKGKDIIKDTKNLKASQILNPTAECNNPKAMADGKPHNFGITITGYDLDPAKTYKCTFIPDEKKIKETDRIVEIPPCTGKLNEDMRLLLTVSIPEDTTLGSYNMELEELKCPECGKSDFSQKDDSNIYTCNNCQTSFNINEYPQTIQNANP